MNFHKHAFLLAVIDELKSHGSWTGKTHVQKAVSLLSDSGLTRPPFEFVLYRHGPYSFEIESELEQMQSYGAILIEPNSDGYGVSLERGEMAKFVERMSPLSVEEAEAIKDVCGFVGSRNVVELERLATASWIRSREGLREMQDVSKRLNRLKPHISIGEAERAYLEVSKWLEGDLAE